jgi:chemotaxis protein histidine kinase CheA
MTQTRPDNSAVTTFANHEVIVPPHKLRKALGPAVVGDDPIARAEAALAGLASEFAGWMVSECDRLEAARLMVAKNGLRGVEKDELYRAAHDIRGEAETFGFGQAGEVAASLCRLIEYTPDAERIPLALVNQHVIAIRAIARESGSKTAAAVAAELAAELRALTNAFLAHENRDRPDCLEDIFGTPTPDLK